ncbi:MAG: TonB-dependent receptor [Planctomycetota bacterium]
MKCLPSVIVLLASAALPAQSPMQELANTGNEPLDPAKHSSEPKIGEDRGDVELLDLEIPQVVTASRRIEQLNEVPFAISVVNHEDIRRSGARTIPDALRLVPGVDVAELTFGQAAVSPRGLHGLLSNQTLVLIDGRQIFDSLFGGTVWGSWPIQLEDIERIEVIRGPGGVTWGANAMNGVINIITKDPRDQKGVVITSGGGSRGWFKQHLSAAVEEGNLRLRVSGEYEGGDGFKRQRTIFGTADDDFKNGRMDVHAIYEASPKDTIKTSAGSGLLDGGFPRPPLGGFNTNRNSGSQANHVMSKWTHKVSDDNYFDLTGYVNDFQLSPGLKTVDYRYQQLALQFGHTFSPAENHQLRWGIDSRTDLLDSSNADPMLLQEQFIATNILGLYVQDEWRFAPKWRLNLGGRIDYENYGGFQPSARAALSFDIADDKTVWGAVSRAFHMPAVGARTLNFPLLNGAAIVSADRNVNAETLIAYELGYRQRFLQNRLNTSVNLFWHEYSDITTLTPRFGPPGLLNFRYDNTAAASTHGVEFDARYKVTERWMLLGHYTYEGMNWRSDVLYQDKDLLSIPAHKFMLGTRYNLTDDLHLSSHLYYVDAVQAPNPEFPFFTRQIDPYFRWDMGAEYEFWKKHGSLAVGVRNLLDSQHDEGSTIFLASTEVPRMIFAEVRFTFE